MKRLLLLSAIPVLLATAASAAPISIQITDGSISFTSVPYGPPVIGFTSNLNLTTTTGSLVGSNPNYAQVLWTYSGTSAITISPSLNLQTGQRLGGSSPTNLILTTPGPTTIYNDGVGPFADRIDGSFGESVTLDLPNLPSSFTVYAPFSGQIKISDYTETYSYTNPPVFLNDYLLSGTGIAKLSFNDRCDLSGGACTLQLASATYTFTPEPQTGYIGLFAFAITGCLWLFHRRKQSPSRS